MENVDADAELLGRLARGEPAAARLIVQAKLPRALDLASRLLGDRHEAEDVAQEAFLRVWHHAARWRAEGARFDTWLHTVVLNLCRDRLRRRSVRGNNAAEMPDPPDPASSAEAALLAAEQDRQVERAVAALPERQREAIALVHFQGCSGQETARIMEVSVEAVESLLARGRRTLRARLASEEKDSD